MAEAIRANIARGYLFRLAMVAFFGGGLGFWCVYDGLVTYPAQRDRALAYRQILDEALETETERAERAASALMAPTPPLQWSTKQWAKQVHRELARKDDDKSEQSGIFLRLTFLYQHLEEGQASKLSEEDRLNLRGSLRKRLNKMTNFPGDFTDDPKSPIYAVSEKTTADWRQKTSREGWTEDDPGEPKNEYAIDQQFYMAGGIFPFALLFLFRFLRSRRRSVEATDEGIVASWGPSVAFSQIDEFDKKRWDKKGIAKIRYSADGKRRTFVLDDCNFEHLPIRAMVRLVESKIRPDQIVGGDPERLEETTAEDDPAADGDASDTITTDTVAE